MRHYKQTTKKRHKPPINQQYKANIPNPLKPANSADLPDILHTNSIPTPYQLQQNPRQSPIPEQYLFFAKFYTLFKPLYLQNLYN